MTMSKLEDLWEKGGGVLIRDFCKKGTSSIQNMSVVNTDTSYYIERDPEYALQGVNKEKKGSIWRLASSIYVIFHILSDWYM